MGRDKADGKARRVYRAFEEEGLETRVKMKMELVFKVMMRCWIKIKKGCKGEEHLRFTD